MDVLQFDHNIGTGATNVFASPPVAAAFAAGIVVGGAGLAGALELWNLADIVLRDPMKMVEKLVGWLHKIKTVLDSVVDRAKSYLLQGEGKQVWVAGFRDVEEPEQIREEYDSIWQIVIRLQNRTQVAIRLNFWGRRNRMKLLQTEFKRAHLLCETLDFRITTYSNTINEIVCPPEKCDQIAQRILSKGSGVA